jgi:hypothetical protein
MKPKAALAPSSHTSRPNPRFNIENPLVIPQGSPISPLLANLYMRRVVPGRKKLGWSKAAARVSCFRAYKAARPGQEPQVQPEIAAALREAGRVEVQTVLSGRLAKVDVDSRAEAVPALKLRVLLALEAPEAVADILEFEFHATRTEVPEVALFELRLSLLRMMTQKDAASLFRIVVVEAQRVPTPGAIFYARRPGTTLKRLAKYLRAAAVRGELRCREPLRAAEFLAQSRPNIICVA